MNKAELIDTLAGQTDQTKADVTRTLDALLDTIEATVARGDKVQLGASAPSSLSTGQPGPDAIPRPAPPSKSLQQPSPNSLPAKSSRTG